MKKRKMFRELMDRLDSLENEIKKVDGAVKGYPRKYRLHFKNGTYQSNGLLRLTHPILYEEYFGEHSLQNRAKLKQIAEDIAKKEKCSVEDLEWNVEYHAEFLPWIEPLTSRTTVKWDGGLLFTLDKVGSPKVEIVEPKRKFQRKSQPIDFKTPTEDDYDGKGNNWMKQDEAGVWPTRSDWPTLTGTEEITRETISRITQDFGFNKKPVSVDDMVGKYVLFKPLENEEFVELTYFLKIHQAIIKVSKRNGSYQAFHGTIKTYDDLKAVMKMI